MSTDAALQGKLAFEPNLSVSARTYMAGSTLREEWMKGWTAARSAGPAPAGTGR